jgi:hypothetical protein
MDSNVQIHGTPKAFVLVCFFIYNVEDKYLLEI